MSFNKHIKKILKSINYDFNKWSRYNATESEIIVKAERNEHPHCRDHNPELHEKEFIKVTKK